MNGYSIILIIATFFIFLFAIADQIRRIKNEEVKKILGKTVDVYLVPAGMFDEPPFVILGTIFATFYIIFIILKLFIQKKLGLFISTIIQENSFVLRFKIAVFFWCVATILAYYERIIEYMILGAIIITIIAVWLVVTRLKEVTK